MTAVTLPRPFSPCCQQPLDGGPVVFWCTGCGHDVHGSAIDREYQPIPSQARGGALAPGSTVPRRAQSSTAVAASNAPLRSGTPAGRDAHHAQVTRAPRRAIAGSTP